MQNSNPADKPVTDAAREKDDFIELVKAMVIAAVIAIGIRSFLFEPFNIPSASMYPTLMIGDYLFVEKYSYGYSKYSFPFGIVQFSGRIAGSAPQRGDVAVFRQPKQVQIDYIKRIVGLPGDRIQMLGGVLYINDEPVTREFTGTEVLDDKGRLTTVKKYIETLPGGRKHDIYEISDNQQLDYTREYLVPDGYYFAMGDNRDQSQDSRVTEAVGFVPAENLVGRASFLFFSVEAMGDRCARDEKGAEKSTLGKYACLAVEWPRGIRFDRIFKSVNAR